MKQSSESAEIIALQALNFIFDNEDYQTAFLENSGISITDLNADVINKAETLAAILDFILQDDQIILNFCKIVKLDPQDIWRARHQLPGSPGGEIRSI